MSLTEIMGKALTYANVYQYEEGYDQEALEYFKNKEDPTELIEFLIFCCRNSAEAMNELNETYKKYPNHKLFQTIMKFQFDENDL